MIDKPKDDIEALEAEFPPASGVAFSDARSNVMASGQNILESDNGVIYEVTPAGERKFFKEIDPPVDVTPGQKIELP
jgi:hypothetical protein